MFFFCKKRASKLLKQSSKEKERKYRLVSSFSFRCVSACIDRMILECRRKERKMHFSVKREGIADSISCLQLHFAYIIILWKKVLNGEFS